MSLVSKRLFSSQGRAQELWRTCFALPRCHASAGTIIGSQQGTVLPSMETLPPVATRSGFPSLSPGGRNFRAFSSLPSSSDEHEKVRTTQITGQADRTLMRNVWSGGYDDSKSKGLLGLMSRQHGSKAWDLSYLSSPKMTQSTSGFSTFAGSNSDRLRKSQQGDVDHPRHWPMRVRYLNTVLLLPLAVIYNKISSLFLLNLSLFWHLNQGIREIMADYVHQEMTRHFIMVSLRLFLIIAMKDVFVSLAL